MHTFVIKQIQEKFPKDGGILFEKYTKERGYYSLFDIKPSYFFYRKQENGTFFDPHNDLVALFTLYQDYQHFKEQTEKINIQESYNIHIHNLIKYVDIYVEKNEKINESNVSRHKPRNKELFEEEIKCITGDEYQLIGDYEKSSKKVTLLHRGCNRKFEIKPISFLSGKRCKYCTQFTHTDNFCIYVENATNKRYTVLGLATNNLYIIHDRETLLDFILDKAKVLQEINRKDGSLYFENINVNVDNLVASSNRIYHDICRTTADNNPIFMEDIINLDRSRPDYMVKGSFRKLKDDGLIIKCYPGVYRFPKDEFTDMELLEARYIRRGNNIIGTYYGNSLASLFLGLKAIDDETRYILTNKEAGTHGRNRTIFGIKVRLKGCKCEITEENYIVLQTLDFLLNYWKYTDANREEVISHVTQYWVKNEIPVSLIIKYKGIYEWKQNSICECAIEVLKCVYQKKENDDKNED